MKEDNLNTPDETSNKELEDLSDVKVSDGLISSMLPSALSIANISDALGDTITMRRTSVSPPKSKATIKRRKASKQAKKSRRKNR